MVGPAALRPLWGLANLAVLAVMPSCSGVTAIDVLEFAASAPQVCVCVCGGGGVMGGCVCVSARVCLWRPHRCTAHPM